MYFTISFNFQGLLLLLCILFSILSSQQLDVFPELSRELLFSDAASSEATSTTAGTPDVEFVDEDKIGITEKLGASLELFLTSVFAKLGLFCASRPYSVIFCGLAISAAFSCGCIYFTVVTDPVELWAAPDSRARVELDYYNEHFE